MDSLDDMLAALEGAPPRQSNYGQAAPRPSQHKPVDDLDDFLDSLDDSPAPAPAPVKPVVVAAPAPKRQDTQVAPPVQHYAEESYHDMVAAPREAQEDEASVHAAHADANWFDPTSAPEFKSPTEATRAFEKEGYSIHMNKGKWINAAQTAASDFRLKGTTSTKVGYIHAITLRALDDYGTPAAVDNPRDFIGCILIHKNTGDEIQCWFRDNGDATYDLAFFAQRAGTVNMQIKLCGNPMFDIDIQVDEKGRSLWIARPNLPAEPGKRFLIDIVTEDGSRPEGVAPFEVQSMGDVEELKLVNNGDGTYRFTCMPMSQGFITIQIMLHGQPIKGSPVTVQVGQKQPQFVKQQSRGVQEKSISGIQASAPPVVQAQPVARPVATATPVNARPSVQAQPVQQMRPMNDDAFYGQPQQVPQGYAPRQSAAAQVSNDDLNALLDELGG